MSDDLMKRARRFSEKVEQGGEAVFQDNQASRIDQASLRAIVRLKRIRRSGMTLGRGDLKLFYLELNGLSGARSGHT